MTEDDLADLAERSLQEELGLGASHPVPVLPGDREREEAEIFARLRPARASPARVALLRDCAQRCMAEAAMLQAGAQHAGRALPLPGE